MTQFWVGIERRTTKDIDFIALFPRDLDESNRRLSTILSTPVDDGNSFAIETFRGSVIWQETAFAGHRFFVQARRDNEEVELQIDVGFDDPLVPPPEWLDYPVLGGSTARVQVIRPELLVAWKLNGLFEHGARRWQAKTLYDLYLLTAHCSLDAGQLTEAIRVAFASRNDPLALILDVVYNPEWWEQATAQARWTKFRAATTTPVPENLVEVAATVARALRPVLEPIVAFPAE
jgi:hypothetical protein